MQRIRVEKSTALVLSRVDEAATVALIHSLRESTHINVPTLLRHLATEESKAIRLEAIVGLMFHRDKDSVAFLKQIVRTSKCDAEIRMALNSLTTFAVARHTQSLFLWCIYNAEFSIDAKHTAFYGLYLLHREKFTSQTQLFTPESTMRSRCRVPSELLSIINQFEGASESGEAWPWELFDSWHKQLLP